VQEVINWSSIMPQSLTKNLIHLIFSTKNRAPLIMDVIRPGLHDYAGGILRNLSSPALIMNSVADHIHVLFNLHRTKALADVVMELKRGTSKWMKEQGSQFAEFYWQNGYGAFSIGQSMIEDLSKYIQNQAEHHQKLTFQEEFRRFLKQYEVEFDERYVWD
jgi:REP element-mobilizing transposase RayT